MSVAEPFYDKLLPLLGFDLRHKGGAVGIGANIVSPPQEFPEYIPSGYYALFFKDLEGIKYEIVCYAHSGEGHNA